MRQALEELAMEAGANVAAWLSWRSEPQELVIGTLMVGDPSALELSITMRSQPSQPDKLYRAAALKLRAVLRTLRGLPAELAASEPEPAPTPASAPAAAVASTPASPPETATAGGRLSLALSSGVETWDDEVRPVFGAAAAWVRPSWSHGFATRYVLATTYSNQPVFVHTSSLRFLLFARRQLAGGGMATGLGLWGSVELGAVWDLAQATVAATQIQSALQNSVDPAAAVALAGSYRWTRQVSVLLGLRVDVRATRTRFQAYGREVFTPPWLAPGAFLELDVGP
jgi:hypothetical protein